MSKAKWIVVGVVIVIAAVCLVMYFMSASEKTNREKWIYKEVYTTAIDSAIAADSTAGEKIGLISQPITQGSVTLYNMSYYPHQHTIICTVDEPEQFGGRVAPYLVTPDNKGFSGWYSSSLTQYGIMKLAFEDIAAYADIAYLDLVDKSTISGAYNPALDNPTRVRIELNTGRLINAGITNSMPDSQKPQDSSSDAGSALEE